MTDDWPQTADLRHDIFGRHHLGPHARDECDRFVAHHFAGKAAQPVSVQGYCSYTLLVGNDTVLQFRPIPYQLDLRVTSAAKELYGTFAPATEYLTTLPQSGLLVYKMERMQGISYRDFMSTEQASDPAFRIALCEDLATFFARSLHQQKSPPLPAGNIGSSLESRLLMLSEDLPARFQSSVTMVTQKFHLLENSPWTLTHGDVVPSNIMLNPLTGRLNGLVDWAEAEMLPFGVSFYGLEEILGYVTDTQFVYYDDADICRRAFYKKLYQQVPKPIEQYVLQTISIARDLGVLLWHGFAFDDGAINRVVQEESDPVEVAYLDALLGTNTVLNLSLKEPD